MWLGRDVVRGLWDSANCAMTRASNSEPKCHLAVVRKDLLKPKDVYIISR